MIRIGRKRSRVMLLLSSVVVLVASPPVERVYAGDDAGVRDFFSAQNPAPRAVASIAPQPRIEPAFAPRMPSFAPPRRAARTRPRTAPTFVALPAERPKAEKTKHVSVSVEPRPHALQNKADVADPVGALMRDPTLRAGDIVVLSDGPKVFKGGDRLPYRTSDFEDVSRSHAVSKEMRRKLLAMASTSSAHPADEIRRKVTGLTEPESAPVLQREASSVRVVYRGYQ